jgi:hypothetical protein
VDATDFTPSPPLAGGLARAADDGRPLYELVVPRRPIVEDLRAVPADATFVATRGTAGALDRLGELDRLVALWANPATPELFRACAAAPSLRALYVCHFKRLADVPLKGARSLEHLMLGWAPRLVDLSFLADLPALRTVYLEDMKRVDLATLPELPQLTGLYLGGGMWETLEVSSFAPFTRLPNLRYLRLSNVKPLDGSLRPLAALQSLRELHLPNFFAIEETARLSAALPTVDGNSLSPFFATHEGPVSESSPYFCERCGGTRTMMTGKPASILCPRCDAAKVQRRVARWEAARASPWPEQG